MPYAGRFRSPLVPAMEFCERILGAGRKYFRMSFVFIRERCAYCWDAFLMAGSMIVIHARMSCVVEDSRRSCNGVANMLLSWYPTASFCWYKAVMVASVRSLSCNDLCDSV